jgi:stage II sporulation protein D
MRSLPLLTSAAAAGALALAPAADGAKTTLTITGRGFGHGVGMSQYGAYGMAKAGKRYDDILSHYYSGTTLGRLSEDPDVRVVLASGRSSVSVAGATWAGNQRLDPGKTYTLVAGGKGVILRQGSKKLFTGASPMVLRPQVGGSMWTGGSAYRGAFEVDASGGRVGVVNRVGLEDYLRGVVPQESIPSWPLEALKAQAVAARSYAVESGVLSADTRSQVYGGASAEKPSTNAAVAATDGQVVTYRGEIVKTYFFSTSGGRTEDVENVWGGPALPYLRSVDDPYDSVSPLHRWTPIRMTGASANAKLSGYVRGSFKKIVVTRRGASPRVISATVVGTRGSTTISGASLRARLGLRDTWAYFKSVTTGVKRKPVKSSPSLPGSPSTGGAGPDGARAAAVRARHVAARTVHFVAGEIAPGKRGQRVRVQRLRGGRWVTVAKVRLTKGGRYEARVSARSSYRVKAGGALGPTVRVR